ncbi:maltase 1-like [Planococcus citri]|uniref:maltase 1-like n=1 Tax=Planococcus citri TaxID=170843 RepID=UPI0031F7757E
MKSLFLTLCLLQISWCTVDRTWWKYTTMYEVYLPSFKDGNGDGMGDLIGLRTKLDHFVEIGVETIYITPHYPSPMVDGGYDITDFTAVHPDMGTMKDFEILIREMNVRGLKLVIDVVLNHCSDQHHWFNKSVHREDPYTDFFLWQDPKGYNSDGTAVPPNNWCSVFGGSVWKWNDKRKQFYLHQFTTKQPDLNLRNEFVKNELKKILKFWVEKGVAGFRMDAVKFFVEDEQLRDEPVSSSDIKVPYYNRDLIHTRTQNQPESYQLLHELRIFLEKVTKKYTDFQRILLTEAYYLKYSEIELFYRWYGTKKYRISHQPLNFFLTIDNNNKNSSYYHTAINTYLGGLPEEAVPNWNMENHDMGMKGYKFGEEYAFMCTSMVMMLPGMAYLYMGQELAVTGSNVRPDQLTSNIIIGITGLNRDFFRHPMPWDDSLNGGFSTNNKVFLPLNPNFWRVNVKRQKEDPNSYYQMFKMLMNLRKTNTLKYGDFKSYVISTWVFAFTRTYKKRDQYVVILNLGSETEFVDLYNNVVDLSIPESMTVKMASPNSGYKIGDQVPTKQTIPKILILRPSAVLVLGTK